MAFEIEDGTRFKIEENTMTISVRKSKEDSLKKFIELLTLTNGVSNNFKKILENEGRYVYINDFPAPTLISKNNLWSKFQVLVN